MIRIDNNAITRKESIDIGFLYQNAKKICKLVLLTENNNFDKKIIDLGVTRTKSNLVANFILGVSLAVAKAAAQLHELPLFRYSGGASAVTLPLPMMNIINGGSHTDAQIAFQEFMIRPVVATNLS